MYFLRLLSRIWLNQLYRESPFTLTQCGGYWLKEDYYMRITDLVPTGSALPICKGPLRGYRWITGAAAGRGKGLSVILNRSEPEQLCLAASLARDGICFDIGANVGLYTLVFARYGKRVFAFEPLPRNLAYLWRILEINHVSNATIVPCAISDRLSLASFQIGLNNALGKLHEAGTQPIPTVPLDCISNQYDVVPNVLKIDVEGSEMAVLHGADTILKRYHPHILLSTHGPELRSNCRDFLQSRGYAVRDITAFEHLATIARSP
jgi:FkbM family methyltransferase